MLPDSWRVTVTGPGTPREASVQQQEGPDGSGGTIWAPEPSVASLRQMGLSSSFKINPEVAFLCSFPGQQFLVLFYQEAPSLANLIRSRHDLSGFIRMCLPRAS